MEKALGVCACDTAGGGESLSSEKVMKRTAGVFTSSFFQSRPTFIERDMVVAPASVHSLLHNRRKVMMTRRKKKTTTFPIKDDAGYIGYLTDDDENVSGDDAGGRMMRLVNCRRQDLLGSDMSFSSCLFLFITVCGLLMLFIFAVSPWGVPPPKRL